MVMRHLLSHLRAIIYDILQLTSPCLSYMIASINDRYRWPNISSFPAPPRPCPWRQRFRDEGCRGGKAFRRVRWPDTNGEPVCPHCGGIDAYDCRRLKGAPRFRCRACVKDFRITSRDAVRQPQASAALLSRGHRDLLQRGQGQVGAGALARSKRLLQVRFRVAAQTREAMAEELKGRVVGGEGKVAEVDGGYFGGYVKPANFRENRRDRRLAPQSERQAQGGGRGPRTRRQFGSGRVQVGSQGDGFLCARVAKGTILNADEAGSWEELHKRFEVRRDQSRRSVQPRRRLHELGGGIFQPYAPRRNRPPSPYRWRLFAPLRARGVMARR